MPNDDWTTKHIFVGETRVVSKVGIVTEDIPYEKQNTYFYHGDHLGSSNYVTDPDGRVYEQLEYTPWGEVWVDHASANLAAGDSLGKVDWTFTSKEYDPETGLYSFPARYYEPQTSRWMSVDPALPDYLPERPVDKEARKRNHNLPGEGGVFNPVNLNVYHYGGNNPLVMRDPDGRHNRWWEMSPQETQYHVEQRQARDEYFSTKEAGASGDVNAEMAAIGQLRNIGQSSFEYGRDAGEFAGGSYSAEASVSRTGGEKSFAAFGYVESESNGAGMYSSLEAAVGTVRGTRDLGFFEGAGQFSGGVGEFKSGFNDHNMMLGGELALLKAQGSFGFEAFGHPIEVGTGVSAASVAGGLTVGKNSFAIKLAAGLGAELFVDW